MGKLFHKASLITAGIVAVGIVLSTSALALMPPYRGSPLPSPKERQSPRPTQISLPTPKTNDHESSTCKSRQLLIDNAFKNLYKRANEIKSKFDSISSRVQTYYTSKVVPSGKSLSNYDSLVEDIEAKKSAVEEALSTTQADINAFNCDNNDLKSDVAKIKSDLKNLKNALKEYKKSIKDLILAIRTTSTGGSREVQSPSPSSKTINWGNSSRGSDNRERNQERSSGNDE